MFSEIIDDGQVQGQKLIVHWVKQLKSELSKEKLKRYHEKCEILSTF